MYNFSSADHKSVLTGKSMDEEKQSPLCGLTRVYYTKITFNEQMKLHLNLRSSFK